MTSRRISTVPTTTASTGGGCLSGFILPPVMVLVVGCLMAAFTIRDPQKLGLDAPSMAESSPVLQAGGISAVFTPEVIHWASAIQTWALAAGIDANLAATVMQIESCGDPLALSRSGAIGLFQVMPYHFDPAEDPYDPETNALRGLGYLKRSLEAAGSDANLAFAGYNGGIGILSLAESGWSEETLRYRYWGSGIYSDAISGEEQSPRLQEWLEAGGASLCRQAGERLHIP